MPHWGPNFMETYVNTISRMTALENVMVVISSGPGESRWPRNLPNRVPRPDLPKHVPGFIGPLLWDARIPWSSGRVFPKIAHPDRVMVADGTSFLGTGIDEMGYWSWVDIVAQTEHSQIVVREHDPDAQLANPWKGALGFSCVASIYKRDEESNEDKNEKDEKSEKDEKNEKDKKKDDEDAYNAWKDNWAPGYDDSSTEERVTFDERPRYHPNYQQNCDEFGANRNILRDLGEPAPLLEDQRRCSEVPMTRESLN
ncbi:hypothetical protein ABW19_dt0208108 [Dactylella cylindrospora]|nr:hypothetical protein ABW19_dt0208108 [Dactylella cylindrospora]